MANITHGCSPPRRYIHMSVSSIFTLNFPSLPLCSSACYNIKVTRKLTVRRSDGGNYLGPARAVVPFALLTSIYLLFLWSSPTTACFPRSYDELDHSFSSFSYWDPGDRRSLSEGQRQLVCPGHTHTHTQIMLSLHHKADSFSKP